MTSLRQEIERARELDRQRKPDRIYKADGLRVKESPTGTEIFYCSVCKGPLVDSIQAREKHAQQSNRCREAMGID
jgi:hypothetical protein